MIIASDKKYVHVFMINSLLYMNKRKFKSFGVYPMERLLPRASATWLSSRLVMLIVEWHVWCSRSNSVKEDDAVQSFERPYEYFLSHAESVHLNFKICPINSVSLPVYLLVNLI
jgi:hypothetical protein